MENHAKYGDSIYFHGTSEGGAIIVCQFVYPIQIELEGKRIHADANDAISGGRKNQAGNGGGEPGGTRA